MTRLLARDKKILIGVVHLLPLPGSPRWGGKIQRVIEQASVDATAYQQGGADGLIIENFGDLPFTRSSVPPETVAAMAAAGHEVRKRVKIPIGFNVLRNDARAALALCAACGCDFIRVNVHVGAMLTDQGLIEGDAYGTLRIRNQLVPNVQILADVHVKHAVALGEWRLESAARDTLERGLADALIVSGEGTGWTTEIDDVKRVRESSPTASILVGSGITAENIRTFLPYVNGAIVGTSLKAGGKVHNPVDRKRVQTLAKAMHAL